MGKNKSPKEKLKKNLDTKDSKQYEGLVKRRRVNISLIVVIVVIAIFLIVNIISQRYNFLKIKEIGDNYISIFFTNFHMQIAIFAISFIVIYLLFYINNKIIKKGLKVFFDKENMPMPNLPNKCISLILALVGGEIALNVLYTPLITCINATSFGTVDPIFGNDLGFYMFTLPFIETLFIFLIVLSLIMVIYTALYYVITINVCLKGGVDWDDLKDNTFMKLIKFWAIVFGVILCVFLLFTAQDILTGDMITIKDDSSTELVGAGLADITVRLWGYRILAIIVLISIINIIRFASLGKYRKTLISALVIPIYLVLMFAVLIYFQEVYVGSSELDKEGEYIAYNIDATKEAFQININQTAIDDYETLTSDMVNNNQDVITNIPIVNEDTIEKTITDNQDNSIYYDYSSSNLGMYDVDGENSLVSLTVREIVNDLNTSLLNSTYEYTHGYSVVISDPSSIDENGYVDVISYNLDDDENTLDINEPRIYYGLETNNTIVVNSNYGDEFDYPTSNLEYEEYSYEGDGGITLNVFDRLVVAMSTGDYRVLFSNYINDDTLILMTRNIVERAKTLLPDIKYDDDPYMIVTDDGRLLWVLDGYTVSNNYPYAQSITITNNDGIKEKINYIRNSVKVIVDSYSGDIKFYITDRDDPIIMMYKNMYPDLFMDEDIPSDIESKFMYPKFLFDIQSQVLELYHDVTEDILYRADDVWSLATDGENKINSKYTMLKSIDSTSASLGLVNTYTKVGKGSLTSFVIGTTSEYGKNTLSLYKFPSDSNIIGVAQMNTLIEEDETISESLKTINVTGVELVKDIIIVPIDNTIVYVEPIYQVRLNEDETQVLKKIIVSSGNKVAIGDSLNEAINNLCSESNSVSIEYVDLEDINDVIDSLIEGYNNLEESIMSNDLEMIGKDIDTLRDLLSRLEVLRKENIKEEEELEKEMEKELESITDVQDELDEEDD